MIVLDLLMVLCFFLSLYCSASFLLAGLGGSPLPPRQILKDAQTSVALAIVVGAVAYGIQFVNRWFG